MAKSQMLLFTAPGRLLVEESPAKEWGDFTDFVEVADDQVAVRHVYLFRNGNSLRYGRAHWCDDFGRLTGVRFFGYAG